MYISEMLIEGYKNCKNKTSLKFNPGLNIIVGENASGKSTVIDAIRMILREPEVKYTTEDDFFKSFENEGEIKKNIRIDINLKNLTDNEKVTFLTWCNADFDAELHMEVEKNPNSRGYYKKSIWGGKSKSSALEEETFDCIDTIYLPALRNAEEKLTSGKKSRLALLLKHQYEDQNRKDELTKAFSEFNNSITRNVDNKYHEISKANQDINSAIKESMGNVFGQSVNLQFAESSFTSILQNIKMVFFPHVGEVDKDKFRDIAINSLGYNNLLYIATVFAELEVINKNNNLFTVLLIEEPEAHLHPQIQSKLIKYLKKLTKEKSNLQIFLTTHSPIIASSVGINSLIHLVGIEGGIQCTNISDFELDNKKVKYLNRWLDATKSTMLFSKGIILVEGISEALVLPSLAPMVLKKYNETHKQKLPSSLEEAGVSVININGINFEYFYPLFADLNNVNNTRLPIRCSGITDKDPRSNDESNENNSGNKATELCEVMDRTINCRLFVSPYQTFEYDLALHSNCSLMAEIIKDNWQSVQERKNGIKEQMRSIQEKNDQYETKDEQVEDAKNILNRIKTLGKGIFSQLLAEEIEKNMNDPKKRFGIPDYICKSIIWACGGCVDEDSNA